MLYRSARAIRRSGSTIAASCAAMLLSPPALASEGGASFYLLGSGGPGAAISPPVKGVFVSNVVYVYDGDAAKNRQFVLGGNVAAGLDATIVADFVSLGWVPTQNFLGGTLLVGGALPFGAP